MQFSQLALFEDETVAGLEPLTLLRPVYELICGQTSVRERALRALGPTTWGAFCRDELTEVYREEFPEAFVNRLDWLATGQTLLVNGAWLCDPHALQEIAADSVGLIDGQVAYVTADSSELAVLETGDMAEAVARLARLRANRVVAPGRLIRQPWELIEANGEQLTRDFGVLRGAGGADRDRPDVSIVGPRELVFIDPTAEIEPYVVIDSRTGPVSIAAGVVIQAFTRIEGPCHIGHGSRLYRANIRGGTTIGPNCRVGGEVEASILQAYVNKYHDGFLGHGYICPWVNLGAQTANSDLKSDYSPVTYPRRTGSVDTGLKKVGCFIGDHTKTGLGSLINTGTQIGVMAMLLPSGGLLPRLIPSFATVRDGAITEMFSMERCFAAAVAAMERRNVEFTSAQRRLLQRIHQRTESDRQTAIERSQRASEARSS